jgi:gamma-glutamyltranspeptidase / glutathione hydrolase
VPQTRPELVGDFGMVASTHWLASAAGMGVLERGGNAADACAAAGFVLQVVEPHLNGPGGDVAILVWDEPAQRPVVICGQGVAPQAATIEAFDDLGLDLVPGNGLLPAVVPGAFGAWCLLVERYGTWPVRDVLEPAVHLAEAGHPLLTSAAAAIGRVSGMFRADWPTSAATWLAGDAIPAARSRFRNPALAATYRRVVAEAEARAAEPAAQWAAARDAWYRGFVADAVDRFCAATAVRDVSGGVHRALLRAADLAAWAPSIEDPVSLDYGGYTVFKTGPWGQGPVFLQQLTLLAEAGLAETEPLSADWVHLIIEATKLAFADREAWYGDPGFVDVPLEDLLWSPYTIERAAFMDAGASRKTRPGSPGGRRPKLPGREPRTARRGAGIGEPSHTGPCDTCHVDVVDRTGLMIAATPSGGWLHSSPTIPELGFCLGTRGQMFWLEDGLASSLRPGSRPRTTLSPSLAFRNGRPYLAFGTPGGDMQDQWSLHFFLNLVHGEHNLQQAVDAPEFHSLHMASSFYPRQAEPGRLVIEDRFPAETIAELRKRGHDVQVVDGWSLGRTTAVARDGEWLRAAANPRGAQAYAVGR